MMAFHRGLLKLFFLVGVPATLCAESNGQKAHFQVEDKSGDLKVIATKDQAKVTAQADSVQVVVDPGTADYPVVKSDKPVVHVSGPMCCNGGWSTYSARKKSALPSVGRRRLGWRLGRKGKVTDRVNKARVPLGNEASLVSSNRFLLKKAGSVRGGPKARERISHKMVGKLDQDEDRKPNSSVANPLHKDRKKLTGSRGLSIIIGNNGNTFRRKTLARNPSNHLFGISFHKSKSKDMRGTKKTEVKGTGPSFHVTGNAGKLKMHVTKDATELTSESGGVDVLLKPPASGSSDKADAQARSKQVVHLATEQGGDFEGLGMKKSILGHVGRKRA